MEGNRLVNTHPIVAALEALEAGDVDLAVAVLSGSLDDGPACDVFGRRRCCPECGAGPMWPGLLEEHLSHVHRRGLPCAA